MKKVFYWVFVVIVVVGLVVGTIFKVSSVREDEVTPIDQNNRVIAFFLDRSQEKRANEIAVEKQRYEYEKHINSSAFQTGLTLYGVVIVCAMAIIRKKILQ